MDRIALVVLVACSSSPSSSTTPPPTTPSAPAAPADAGVASSAAPVDAPAVDDELAAAPASVFRFHATGLARTKDSQRLETWMLRHVGARGSVLVERMSPDGDHWKPASKTLYVGAAADDGTSITLTLAAAANPNDKLSLVCKREKLDVAAATAVRKPHPKKGKFAKPCSGDPGRWVPDKTTSVEVLSCKHPDYDAPMPFAASPGVEYLYVNDDCDMQGGGYRGIADDGAIAPVR